MVSITKPSITLRAKTAVCALAHSAVRIVICCQHDGIILVRSCGRPSITATLKPKVAAIDYALLLCSMLFQLGLWQ